MGIVSRTFSSSSLPILLLFPFLALSTFSTAFLCPRGSDFKGVSIPSQLLHVHKTEKGRRFSTPSPRAVRVKDLGGKLLSGRRVFPRSTVKQIKGQAMYVLRNFCIRPYKQGGVTFFDLQRPIHALRVCNEVGYHNYSVSSISKPPLHFFTGARWISSASALILPLTAGNPWHFLHHLLPLTLVLQRHGNWFSNASVHIHPTLAKRHFSGRPPPSNYFSVFRFPWWPLLSAATPHSFNLSQVDHLEIFEDSRRKHSGSATLNGDMVCYARGILGTPQTFDTEESSSRKLLLPPKIVQLFRSKAVRLATGKRLESCHRKDRNMKKPLMGIIVRAGTRKLCNLPDLVQVARNEGFEVELISFEKMNVFEQIRASQRINVLVGVHGAGITNVFWLRNGSALIEMYPDVPTEHAKTGKNVNQATNYGRFAYLAGVDHYVYISVRKQNRLQPNVNFRKLDMVMDVSIFQKLMKAVKPSFKTAC